MRKEQESTPPCKPVLQCTGLGLQHEAFGGPIQGAWSYRAGRVGLADSAFVLAGANWCRSFGKQLVSLWPVPVLIACIGRRIS